MDLPMNMQPIELKAYYRDLVTACGGPKRASELVGGQASHISEAMAPHSERWPRLDHVAVLEAECRQPVVTRALAERIGFALEASSPVASSKSLLQHLTSIVTESRDVEMSMLDAMQDGRVDAAERRVMRKQIQEAMAALTALDVALVDPASAANITRLAK